MKKPPNPVCSSQHRNNNQPQKAKTPLKNPTGEKSRSLPMQGGGVFLRPPLPMSLSAYRCLLFSVVLIYFSVNVHEVILDDLIDRRLNGPTVFLI